MTNNESTPKPDNPDITPAAELAKREAEAKRAAAVREGLAEDNRLEHALGHTGGE
jgi:hypothetical protein